MSPPIDYKPGEYLVVCDRCGGTHKRSRTKKEWTGSLTCPDCWDAKHNLDTPPPPPRDNIVLPAHQVSMRPVAVFDRVTGVWETIAVNWEDINWAWNATWKSTLNG